MRFWYHLSENYDRECAKRRGETPPPITLYEETEQIVRDFQRPENLGGWTMLGERTGKCEFDSLEEAYDCFYELWDGKSARKER